MMLVKLPVSDEAWKEIAAEVTARGQGDRIDYQRKLIDLRDVALTREPELKQVKAT
jgi:hypothetical protein